MEEYLNNKICAKEFMSVCEKIYSQSIVENDADNLDSIVYLPFIHEFAFWPYLEDELKEEVVYFSKIHKCEQPYQYSCFFKFSNRKEVDNNLRKLLQNRETLRLSDLADYFVAPISDPKTLRDIIYNLICDVLSKIDENNWEESDFDYHNLDEEVTYGDIEEIISRYLSYYLGNKKFYLNVQICSDGNKIYTII